MDWSDIERESWRRMVAARDREVSDFIRHFWRFDHGECMGDAIGAAVRPRLIRGLFRRSA